MLVRTTLDKALYILPIVNRIGLFAGEPNLHVEIERALNANKAFLFVDTKSFVVLQPRIKGDVLMVIVRIAWSKAGDALEKYQSEIIELAKMIGATRLRFETARRGFDKRAPQLGWTKTLTTWEQDL